MTKLTSSFKTIAYQTVEALTGKKGVARSINGVKIRFPVKYARYYNADYEPETFTFLRENLKTGDTMLDIGAHIGLFSVVGAELVTPGGRVFSFEPTPHTSQVLSEVVRINDLSDTVFVRREAVSNSKGKTVFYDTGDDVSNANSLVKLDRRKVGIDVDVTSVDAFVQENALSPNCLKIDVEGAELDLLRGAKATFLKYRPVARLGLHPNQIGQNGQSLDEIWNVIDEYQYRVKSGGNDVERQWFCSQQDLFDVNLIPS